MNRPTFEKAVKHQLVPWASSPEMLPRKKVVLLDGAKCHISIPAIRMLREVNAVFVFLPPNATHILQALVSMSIHYSICYWHFLMVWVALGGKNMTLTIWH